MKTSVFLFCFALSNVALNTAKAQKPASFEYSVLKDSIPFDVDDQALTYADSNSVLQVVVSNPKLPKKITWEVAQMTVMTKLDSKMLHQIHHNNSSAALRLPLSKLFESAAVMREKNLSHKPGLLLQIDELRGRKGEKEKTVKTSHFIEIKINNGIK